ncbi:MAG: hypothetical protein RIR01_164 [Bacteroidota bacterium]
MILNNSEKGLRYEGKQKVFIPLPLKEYKHYSLTKTTRQIGIGTFRLLQGRCLTAHTQDLKA